MRVVFTTFGFPLYRHSFIEDHVLALAALGVDVHVVASAVGDHELRQHGRGPSAGSVAVLNAPWSAARARKALTLATSTGSAAINNRREGWELARALRRQVGWGRLFNRMYVMAPAVSRPAAIVHIGWLAAATEWTALLRAIKRPVVVSCHGADLLVEPLADQDYAQRVREVFSVVDLVHCVSDELAEQALLMGLDPSKLFVGSWGTDSGFFCPSPVPRAAPSRTLRIVSIGRVHWVKGYECAIQALHQVREAGIAFHYTIFGEVDPKARQSVLTAVHDFGLEDQVQLCGLATREQVLDELRTSDVFLLTSLREGVCTSALEAMSVGLPVIVTDVGGMRDAVADGGLVVPPRDPGAVADAILRLAHDASLREEMGRSARRRAMQHFEVADCSAKLLEHYQRLVNNLP